jgi:hypothetical protein
MNMLTLRYFRTNVTPTGLRIFQHQHTAREDDSRDLPYRHPICPRHITDHVCQSHHSAQLDRSALDDKSTVRVVRSTTRPTTAAAAGTAPAAAHTTPLTHTNTNTKTHKSRAQASAPHKRQAHDVRIPSAVSRRQQFKRPALTRTRTSPCCSVQFHTN